MKLFSSSRGGAHSARPQRQRPAPAVPEAPAADEIAAFPVSSPEPVQSAPEPVIPEIVSAPTPAPEPVPESTAVLAARRSLPLPLSLAALALGLLLTVQAGIRFHFPTETKSTAKEHSTAVVHLADRFAAGMNNAKSDALSDLVYIKKVYTIEESATAAPRPDPACFGCTTDPAVIRALVDASAPLLDGQDTVWNEDIVLLSGGEYNYYRDETILVITWKELIDGKACTLSEVRIADPSQLRRKITGDTYDSPIRLNASELAEQANAVIAMNADFYGFRPLGITVYDRTLYRCEGDKLDTCFFNTAGEMVMVRAGELTGREETEQFIRDNDILFSTSFGPILVENGEKQPLGSYPIGEVTLAYSRAAIGMTAPLHYLFLNINYDAGIGRCATIQELADIIYSKGVTDAYTLDGGQTSEVYMNGKMINHVDWGAERAVSDILYFATALPAGTEG